MCMEREYPINPDAVVSLFWVGNVKASEIWRKIGTDLTMVGFTWPKYLRLLRLLREEVFLYQLGELSLTLFVGTIINKAKGPLGRLILEKGG